jgi:peptide/nickel transport system substrate-binding protein
MRRMWGIDLLILIGFVVAATVAHAGGKEIVVAVGVDATSLDPPISTNITDKNVTSAVYDTLLYRNADMKLEPWLATSWRLVDDLTWEFKLRQGIRFHDGEPFNAEAVKFSLERILDPNLGARSFAQYTALSRVDIVDPYTVRVITKEPYPIVPVVMAETWIVPPKYTREKGKEVLARQPVGTGPFRFKEWSRASSITVEANREYWHGPPKVDQVTFKVVPEIGARVALLKTGGADIISAVPPHLVKTLEDDPNVRVARAEGARAYFIGMNTFNKGPLQDKRVRQALNMGVNAELILDTIFNKGGKRLATLLTPRHFGNDPSIKPYPYDPAKAKAMLAQAGYAKGLTLEMDTPDGRYPLDKEAAMAIAGQLGEIGVQVNVKVKEWGNYVDQFKKSKDLPVHLYYMGWSIPTFDADAILYALATPNTYCRYVDDEVAKQLTQARSTMNPSQRAALYHRALRTMREDAPMVFLYALDDLYGVRKRVNWEPRSDERILLHEASIKE